MTEESSKLPRIEAAIIAQELAERLQRYEEQARSEETRLVLDISDIMKNEYVSPEQAAGWGATEDPDISTIVEILTTQKKVINRLRSVADYGCGSGRKGARVYKTLEALVGQSLGKLHLIDNSPDILSRAYENCAAEGLQPWQIHVHKPVNFEEMGKLKDLEKIQRLHLFLGQTIGNFQNPEEVIRNMGMNMRKGDYFLVEWFVKNPEDYRPFEEWYRSYLALLGIKNEAVGNFNPVEERDAKGKRWNIMPFMVQDVPVDKRTIEIQRRQYELKPGTRVIVSRSRRFDENEIIRLVEKEGLEAKEIDVEVDAGQYIDSGDNLIFYDKPLKYKSRGTRRYALFKKKPSHKVRNYLLGATALLAAGLATGIALTSGPDVECYNGRIDGTAIVCQKNGKERVVYVDQLKRIEAAKDHIYFTTKTDLEYKVTLDEKEKRNIEKILTLRKKAQGMIPVKGICENWNTSFTHADHKNDLEVIAGCTTSERAVIEALLTIDTLEESGITVKTEWVLHHIARTAALYRDAEPVIHVSRQYRDKKVIRILQDGSNRKWPEPDSKSALIYLPELANPKLRDLTDKYVDVVVNYIREWDGNGYKAKETHPLIAIAWIIPRLDHSTAESFLKIAEMYRNHSHAEEIFTSLDKITKSVVVQKRHKPHPQHETLEQLMDSIKESLQYTFMVGNIELGGHAQEAFGQVLITAVRYAHVRGVERIIKRLEEKAYDTDKPFYAATNLASVLNNDCVVKQFRKHQGKPEFDRYLARVVQADIPVGTLKEGKEPLYANNLCERPAQRP